MSTFKCPLIEIENLEPHPNADSLSVVVQDVLDGPVVVKTSDFEHQRLAVYVPIGAVCSDKHALLSFLEGKPVKVAKLRKIDSHGILLPWPEVETFLRVSGFSEASLEKVKVLGRDFSGILKIRKFVEEGMKISVNAEASTVFANIKKYTDIEAFKNFRHCLNEGELVNITEKIHGTSARYAYMAGLGGGSFKFVIGSRNCELSSAKHCNNIWTRTFYEHDIQAKLLHLAKLYPDRDVVLFGEIAGKKVQKLDYGCEIPEFFAYDISVGGEWIDPLKFIELCRLCHIKTVPQLFESIRWCSDLLSERNGKSTLGNHIREGIVVKPIVPRHDRILGRVILKVVGEDYLSWAGKTFGSDYVQEGE